MYKGHWLRSACKKHKYKCKYKYKNIKTQILVDAPTHENHELQGSLTAVCVQQCSFPPHCNFVQQSFDDKAEQSNKSDKKIFTRSAQLFACNSNCSFHWSECELLCFWVKYSNQRTMLNHIQWIVSCFQNFQERWQNRNIVLDTLQILQIIQNILPIWFGAGNTSSFWWYRYVYDIIHQRLKYICFVIYNILLWKYLLSEVIDPCR